MLSGPLALLVRRNVVHWQTAETILTAPNKPGNRRFIELSMVGATGIEPVTPTMSTLRPQRNVRKIRHFSRHAASFPARCCPCVHGFGFTRAKEHYVEPCLL